mmetsp:Transcript_12537/g.26318  ORF Transcript_12537/g.26318 Transcript_12537/m.26318 type:complete len:223 (-) Transcript_12537:573-1241(-)
MVAHGCHGCRSNLVVLLDGELDWDACVDDRCAAARQLNVRDSARAGGLGLGLGLGVRGGTGRARILRAAAVPVADAGGALARAADENPNTEDRERHDHSVDHHRVATGHGLIASLVLAPHGRGVAGVVEHGLEHDLVDKAKEDQHKERVDPEAPRVLLVGLVQRQRQRQQRHAGQGRRGAREEVGQQLALELVIVVDLRVDRLDLAPAAQRDHHVVDADRNE